MKQKIELKFHEKNCFNCRYYRTWNGNNESYSNTQISECILLGRTLSLTGDSWHDRARHCDAFKKRPKTWWFSSDKNPHWFDKYIPRETLINLRKKLGIK